LGTLSYLDREQKERMRTSMITNFLLAGMTLLMCLHRDNALLVPLNKWLSTASATIRKTASIATTVVCICGLPSITLADEPASLQNQLKIIQDSKVASQKLAIESAEQNLQTKELLYPEGRLIGRGIIKLIPESGITVAHHIECITMTPKP
jgi:hypothetical protein